MCAAIAVFYFVGWGATEGIEWVARTYYPQDNPKEYGRLIGVTVGLVCAVLVYHVVRARVERKESRRTGEGER